MIDVNEYARMRGVDRRSVVKAIEEGRISAACAKRGREWFIMDTARASELWEQNTIPKAPAEGSNLQQARMRANLARIDELEREVTQLRSSVVTPADAATELRRAVEPVVKLLRAMPQPCTDADAQAFLHAVQALPCPPATATQAPAPRPTTAAEVEALRVSLSAERQELRNHIASGELVAGDSFMGPFEDALTALRMALVYHLDPAEALAGIEQFLSAAGPAEVPRGSSSEAMRAKWKDPVFRAAMGEKIRAGMARKRAQS